MKKIINITIMFIVFLLLFSVIPVLAKSKLDFAASINQEKIKSGQTLVVTLKLEQYVEDGLGINAYKARLDYNKNIFEELSEKDFLCQNYWGNLQYNKITGEFVSIRKDGNEKIEDLLVISFKVRNDVDIGTTEIKLKDIVASDGRKDLFIDDKIVKVDVINDSGKLDDSKVEHLNSNFTTKDTIKSSYINENFKVVSNFQEKSKFNEIILVVVFLLVIIIYAIIRRFSSDYYYDDDYSNKKIFAFIVALLVFLQGLIVCSSLYYKFMQKGELNDDGVIDYLDVDSLEYHLTQIKSLDDKALENADINNDKSITITDLSRLNKKIDGDLVNEVNLSTIKQVEEETFNKDEDIDLSFIAGVRNDFNIVEVVIDGVKYKVDKVFDSNSQYSVRVNTGDSSGIKKYHFTEVLFDNGNRVDVDYTRKIKVLKDVPRIDNYITQEYVDEKKINLSFNLIDDDNSISSSIIRVDDDVGNIIDSKSIKKGKNSIFIPVEAGKLYNVKFILKYDLDMDKSGTSEISHKNVVETTKKLQLVEDYQFKIDNIVITNGVDTTNIFEKGQSPKIVFSSVNNSLCFVEKVIVNGKYYDVIKDGDIYSAVILQFNKLGKQDIYIEGVVLDNGKRIIFDEEKKLDIDVVKRKASILNFSVEENIELYRLLVKAELNDKDNSIYKVKLVLLDDKGMVIDSKDINTKDFNNNKIEENFDTNISSKYIVKIIGFSSQVNNNETVLFEKEVEAKTHVDILNVFGDSLNHELNDYIALNFNIIHNKNVSISKICINDIFYEVFFDDEFLYKVVIPIENNNTYQLIVTKILFSDGSLANVNKFINIEYSNGIYSVSNSQFNNSYNIQNMSNLIDSYSNYELKDVLDIVIISNLGFIKNQGIIKLRDKLKKINLLLGNSLIDKYNVDNNILLENLSILSKCITKMLFPSRAGPKYNKSMVEYFGLEELCSIFIKDNYLDKDLYIRNIDDISYYNVPISMGFYPNYINNMSHIFNNLINRLIDTDTEFLDIIDSV